MLSLLFLTSMHFTFSETLIPDSRSFFLANQLLSAVGQPFYTNDLAQPLSSPVIGDNHKGETLYVWGEYPDWKWVESGDKDINQSIK